MNLKIFCFFVVVSGLIAITCDFVVAQPQLPIRCTGDNVIYHKEEGVIDGNGNVEIIYKDNYLKADSVKVNLKTKEIEAEGRVVVSDGKNIFTGDRVLYNMETGEGGVDNIRSCMEPWYAVGKEGQRVSEYMYYVQDGYVTTCDYEEPHYKIKAKHLYIYPEDKIVAKHIVFYWKNVPLLYWPYFSKSLKDKRNPWTVIPGQNTLFGKYLLLGYSIWWENFLGGTFEPTVRLDWYEKRGIGTGVYAKYSYKDEIRSLIRSYIIKDKAYVNPEGQTEEKLRGRFHVEWIQDVADRTRAIAKLNYLSDETIIYDFFMNEFQDEIQTENYIDMSYSTDIFQLSGMLRKRFHNFYNVLEKLPEINFNLLDQRIGKSRLFYQGSAGTGYLKQLFKKGSPEDDYDSFRFDTRQQLRYPRKYFGWLNIIPRIGTRQTYYNKRAEWVNSSGTTTEVKPTEAGAQTGTTTQTSESSSPTKETTVITTTTVNPDTTTVTKETNTKEKESINKNTVRSVYFTGAEFTTKISRVFRADSDFWKINQLRHVVEPRINYSYQHEPTVPNKDLLDFGDGETKQNYFTLGLRNKLQTRRDNQAWDLLDLHLGVNYYPERIEEDGKERDFSHVGANLEIDPFDWFEIQMDANYDQYDRQLDSFNTQLALYKGDKFSFALEYRYSLGNDKLWTSEVNYTLDSNWSFRFKHRFDFNTNQLQEQEYIVFRDLHCWNVAFTYREYSQIGEREFFFVLYPKAYPAVPVTFGTTFFGQTDTAEVNFSDMRYDVDYGNWGEE